MTALAVAATALLWWHAEALVALQYPRFEPATQVLTVRLTRIVLPAQIFFVAGGILRAALMAHDRFWTHALAPLLYNGFIIAGGLAFGTTLGAEGFAWGALVGALTGPFLVPVLDALSGAGLRLRVRIALFDAELLRYLGIALPLMLGLSLLTVDEWYDRWFGALQGEGAVAQLTYARRLMQLPVAVIGQAIATAALPTLSRLWNEGRREELDRVLLDTLRVGLGLAVLGAAACIAFATPIVEFVYHHGAFTERDVVRVARLLAIFALAVPAWVVQQIAVRSFFARGDTWRPMLVGTAVALAVVPLYVAFGRLYGVAGLAAAGVLGMSANAVFTLALARRLHGTPQLGALVATGARVLTISAVAALAGATAAPGAGRGFAALGDLAIGGVAFAAVALAGVFAVGDEPLRAVIRRAAARLRRS
jgi:putative peptidoglycan lipid II flippase